MPPRCAKAWMFAWVLKKLWEISKKMHQKKWRSNFGSILGNHPDLLLTNIQKHPKSCLWKCRFLGSHSVHLNFLVQFSHTLTSLHRNWREEQISESLFKIHQFKLQFSGHQDHWYCPYLPHNLPAFRIHPEVDRWSMYFSLENWGVPASHLTLSFGEKRSVVPKEDITRKRDFLPTFFGEHFCYTFPGVPHCKHSFASWFSELQKEAFHYEYFPQKTGDKMIVQVRSVCLVLFNLKPFQCQPPLH